MTTGCVSSRLLMRNQPARLILLPSALELSGTSTLACYCPRIIDFCEPVGEFGFDAETEDGGANTHQVGHDMAEKESETNVKPNLPSITRSSCISG